MRNNYLNSGRQDEIKPSRIPDKSIVPFWEFQTAGPIYSTPVISADGTIFIGSADGVFYALSPKGRLKWSFRTGRLIDSAGAVAENGVVYVPSGDGNVYALDQKTGKKLWQFSAPEPERLRVEKANWFEGNISLRPDGLIMAPNDDFCVYFLNPDGKLKNKFCTRGMVWSAIPTDEQGRNFFCSLDFSCYGLSNQQKFLWKKTTWGVVSSSPAVGKNGRVYFASFDGNVYAVDAKTGKTYWKFKTRDHIYGSPAIGKDRTIYIGSCDGTFYALTDLGKKAQLKWAFDTLDPIRSSPVIDGDGNIYFGNSAGKVFVLSSDGKRRWSIDLTRSDKNDINASIALGKKAFYVAMEDGRVVQIPYDYCLRQDMRQNPNCNLNPEEDLPEEGVFIYWMSLGGKSLPINGSVFELPEAGIITLRLVIRENGETIPAGIEKKSLKIVVEPDFPFHYTVSMDHRFLNIVPEGFLSPGTYLLKVQGKYRKPKIKLFGHIWLCAGKRLGEFEAKVRFQVPAVKRKDVQAKPLVFTGLSFYQPLIFPSVAQIGMDDLKFIAVPVEKISEQSWLFWVMLAVPDENKGFKVAPSNRITFPAKAKYLGEQILLEAGNFAFDYAGDRFGFKLLRLAGKIEEAQKQNLISENSLYAEGKSLSMAGAFYNVPLFGTPLSGTCRINSYQFSFSPPEGFGVESVLIKHGKLMVKYRNSAGIKIKEHHLSVLLIDRRAGRAVNIDYPRSTRHISDEQGNIIRTEIELPAKLLLKKPSKNLTAVVFYDGVIIKKSSL